MANILPAPPINISICKMNVSHHYGQKETMSLCPVSPPPHWASTPANEAKVLWKQCGPLTEKDALCSAADFQSEWISGAEVAYLITACCLGWKWTMSLGISLPCLYIHPEIANRTVLIQHKGKWVRLFIYFHTINPLWHALVLGICFSQYLFLVADTLQYNVPQVSFWEAIYQNYCDLNFIFIHQS